MILVADKFHRVDVRLERKVGGKRGGVEGGRGGGRETMSRADMKAARDRAVIPLEIRMRHFRQMLTDKQVIFT